MDSVSKRIIVVIVLFSMDYGILPGGVDREKPNAAAQADREFNCYSGTR